MDMTNVRGRRPAGPGRATVGVALVAAGGVLLGGCVSGPPRPAVINHLAFFKLKDPADAPALIADCDTLLRPIPGVTSYYAGPPIDVGRTSVDGDYDVGFFVGFDTVDDYLAYVEHPDHVRVVQRWGPRLEWLRTHDVLDETP